MLDLHRLHIFLMVAKHKSFSKAARELYLTQPTISQHIGTLEHHLNTVLFDRLGKEAVLTRSGEVLYRYARQIDSLTREAGQALDHFLGKRSGHLQLGASTIPGEYILPQLLGQFKSLYPGVSITLNIADSEQIVHNVLERDIELGIVGARFSDPGLRATRLLDEELALVVPQGHRWWQRHTVAPDELIAEPFLLRERGSGTRMNIEKMLKQSGISIVQLNIVAEIGSTSAVKQAIRSHLGVSFVSELAIQEELRLKVFKKIPVRGIRMKRSFYIIRNRRRTSSPLCKAFDQFISPQS